MSGSAQWSGWQAGQGWDSSRSRDSDAWWRDPVADEDTNQQRRELHEDSWQQHGPPLRPSAWDGPSRAGHAVDCWPRPGQTRGVSGSRQETFPPHEVFRVDIPLSLKDGGSWWSELKASVENDYEHHKISIRPKRWNASGPGWNTLTAMGRMGDSILEQALKDLSCVSSCITIQLVSLIIDFWIHIALFKFFP